MRAYFKNMLLAYSGACDGLIYYYNRRLGRVLVRPYVKPRPTENNRRFGRTAANLKALAPSAAYKSDLRVYVDIFNSRVASRDVILQNWYNAFTRLMWNLAKQNPEYIDLETLTRSQIEANDLPCRTVKRAVEAGLLDPVHGYEHLTAAM